MGDAGYQSGAKERLSPDTPQGYKNLVVKPGFRRELLKILADGHWHTTARIATSFHKTFPTADIAVVRRALSNLLRDPPHGKEVISKKVGKKMQYRMRDAAVGTRQVPTKLVTSLIEGIAPVIDELRYWARQNQYEITPSAMAVLAARLDKLLEPLQKDVS
jgi:hypothetical protein